MKMMTQSRKLIDETLAFALFNTHSFSCTSMVLDLIQQHVVQRFGYRHVNALRTAQSRFPDDPVVKNAFYSE